MMRWTVVLFFLAVSSLASAADAAAQPSPVGACLATRLHALFPSSPEVRSELRRLPTSDASAVATALTIALEQAQGKLLYLGLSGPTPEALTEGIREAATRLAQERMGVAGATAWSDLTLVYYTPTPGFPTLTAAAREHGLALRVEPVGACAELAPDSACAPSLVPLARHRPLIMPRQTLGLRTLRGIVVLHYTVERDGRVSDPRVHWSTSSLFDRMAVDYVQGFEYAPRAAACVAEHVVHAHYTE